jgi:hypothetical protein
MMTQKEAQMAEMLEELMPLLDGTEKPEAEDLNYLAEVRTSVLKNIEKLPGIIKNIHESSEGIVGGTEKDVQRLNALLSQSRLILKDLDAKFPVKPAAQGNVATLVQKMQQLSTQQANAAGTYPTP